MENIFEYAMQMEKDGEDYYRQLAQKIDNNGMKTILTMLADEEVKHYNAIEKIKKQKTQIAESEVLILTSMRPSFIKEPGTSRKRAGTSIRKKPARLRKNIRKSFFLNWLMKNKNIMSY